MATFLTVTDENGTVFSMYRVDDLEPEAVSGRIETRFMTAVEVDPATKKPLDADDPR